MLLFFPSNSHDFDHLQVLDSLLSCQINSLKARRIREEMRLKFLFISFSKFLYGFSRSETEFLNFFGFTQIKWFCFVDIG